MSVCVCVSVWLCVYVCVYVCVCVCGVNVCNNSTTISSKTSILVILRSANPDS